MLSATLRTQLEAEIADLEAQKIEISSQLELLHRLLWGEAPVKRMGRPKSSGAKASESVIKRKGGGKRTRRSPEQMKEWANTVSAAVKLGGKGGAKKSDIEKQVGETLPQAWFGIHSKIADEKLKRTGNKSTSRYFIK